MVHGEGALMRKHGVNPFYSGIAVAIVLIVALVAVVISGIPGGPQIPVPWNQFTTLHVQLADADALAPHDSVEISGVKVGEVQAVEAGPTYSVATIEVQQQYADIHRDAVVYLRA
ncbi:MAG TPA: MlaD family protein, partial [Dehalococcoidia bacterium]|nr:MlaD family protein [Dehalococcoidia bacterium]